MKVIQICFSCSMLCTDGLLLHLVGKRQLLVYLGAAYGNGKLGDSIWESHHKSSAQGARRQTLPHWVEIEMLTPRVGQSCCTRKRVLQRVTAVLLSFQFECLVRKVGVFECRPVRTVFWDRVRNYKARAIYKESRGQRLGVAETAIPDHCVVWSLL